MTSTPGGLPSTVAMHGVAVAWCTLAALAHRRGSGCTGTRLVGALSTVALSTGALSTVVTTMSFADASRACWVSLAVMRGAESTLWRSWYMLSYMLKAWDVWSAMRRISRWMSICASTH